MKLIFFFVLLLLKKNGRFIVTKRYISVLYILLVIMTILVCKVLCKKKTKKIENITDHRFYLLLVK